MLANGREAGRAACVLDLIKQEIQHNEIQVLDFIRTGFDEHLRRHEGRDVAADPQAARMGGIGDDGYQLRFDG